MSSLKSEAEGGFSPSASLHDDVAQNLPIDPSP
jgi:hypothetical protein